MKVLDTNIVIRYLANDDLTKAQASFALLQRVAQGAEQLLLTEAVLCEVAYVLTSPRLPYQRSRENVRQGLASIIALPGMHLPHKSRYLRALDLFVQFPALDFEDTVIVALSEAENADGVYGYDRHFDRVPTVTRLEP